VVFRGETASLLVIGGLAVYALVMGFLAWLALRRDVTPARA
jgi:hypothetical protein